MPRKSCRGLSLAAALILGLAPGARAQVVPTFDPQTGDYRLVVTNVDSSNFPRIKLEFQVFVQNPAAPSWDPAGGVDLTEEVLGQVQAPDGSTVSEITPCKVHDVVLAVAVDTSGSVAGVMDEIKQGVLSAFTKLKNTTEVKDRAGVYTFDSNRKFRFPAEGASPPYTAEGANLASEFSQVQGGGFSPIWEGMGKELDVLLAYDPSTNGQKADAKKVLASFTDGQDNRSTDQQKLDLLNKARRGGALLMNLGYADQNSADLKIFAEASGGAYMEGLTGKITNALHAILEGVRTTYCLEYDSPNPNIVNEPATVTVASGSSMGAARYPLPFVIPEDSRDIELFMPVTRFVWETLKAGGEMPKVDIALELRDENGQPWEPRGPDRPHRTMEFQLPVDAWRPAVNDDPNGDWGFYIRDVVDPARWDELFQVPTDFVDLQRGPGQQVIEGVDHYVVKANFRLEGFQQGAGRQYPSSTRLSIQDRTPPHVFLQVRPQDGGPVLRLRALEQEVDEDPALFPDGRPSSVPVREAGTGEKRAAADYSWRDDRGERVDGRATEIPWSVPQQDGTIAPGLAPGAQGPVFQQGIVLTAGTRATLEILARDNFALLEEAPAPEERQVFTEDAPDPVRGPVHAQFDPNRREAQSVSLEPPFLTRRTRSELEGDRKLEGITWWIESPGDDRDRNAGFEGLTEVVYSYSDDEVRAQNPLPPGPLRFLMVRAQDGQGNTTLAKIPLIIARAGFDSRTVEYQSRRQRAFE